MTIKKSLSYFSATVLMLSSASLFAASCEVLQSRTLTVAENNTQGYPPATAGIGGKMDLAPFTGSDFLASNPVELYLDGQLLSNNSLASLDDVNWQTTDLVDFGSASIKNFRVVLNFNDGSSVECDNDIEVRLNDADPIVNQLRFDVSDTSGGVEVNVRAVAVDTDGAANVSMDYELVQGPSVSLPAVDTDYDPNWPFEVSVTDQKLNFSASGNYSLRIRVTDENGNSNVSDTVNFSIDGNCATASNAAHVSAGRAYNFFGFVYAKGSNYWLGYYSSGAQTSLQQWLPNYWLPVIGCF